MLEEGEEKRQGILLFNLVMTTSENAYFQYSSGYIDNQSWEDGRLSSIKDLVNRPMYEIWKDSGGGQNHSRIFGTVGRAKK